MKRNKLISILTIFICLCLTGWLILKTNNLYFGSSFEKWQELKYVKNCTGVILMVMILSQWILSSLRVNKKPGYNKWNFYRKLHLLVGLLTLFVAFLHAVNFGFGILFFLMLFFLINTIISALYALGIISLENIGKSLLPLHIIFSTVVTALSIFHWWIVMTYN